MHHIHPSYFHWSVMFDTESLKAHLRKRKEPEVRSGEYVSFGVTALNLAATGKSLNGLEKGSYCLLVGGSNSGKTYLGLSVMAEACYNEKFDDHDLVYNGPEDGARMDLRKCFGRLADRLELLTPGNGASSSPEEFYDHLDDRLKSKPCIYLLDSMDALVPKDDEEQVAKERAAREAGKDSKGTYGTAKAKVNSQRLRTANNLVVSSGSILIIISQTRDNIGFGSQFQPETRSGGTALRFYAQTELWLKKVKTLKKSYKGNDVQKGGVTRCRVVRSRDTGQQWEVEFPIYHETGIDDVEASIRWLIDWKYWKGNETKVEAPEFDFSGSVEDLSVQLSNDPRGANRLRKIVAKHWKTVAEATKVQRRSKYE